jgi:hypothetical protein
MIFDLNTFFSMNTLIIGLCALVVYLVFFLIPDTINTYGVFKHIKDNYEEFLIDYTDCEDLSDKIALYIVRNF